MDAKLLKVILDDETLTDEQIAVLLVKAQKQAANQHFWADDDIPTEAELERFYNRYEFEIYDLAKAINSDDARVDLYLTLNLELPGTGDRQVRKILSWPWRRSHQKPMSVC